MRALLSHAEILDYLQSIPLLSLPTKNSFKEETGLLRKIKHGEKVNKFDECTSEYLCLHIKYRGTLSSSRCVSCTANALVATNVSCGPALDDDLIHEHSAVVKSSQGKRVRGQKFF